MTKKDFKYFKDYLDNLEMEVFMKRGTRIQALLRDVPVEHLQALGSNGEWFSYPASDGLPFGFSNGMIYRVNPDWEGPKDPVEPTAPAKPPAQRYVDKKPYCRDGAWFVDDREYHTIALSGLKTGVDNGLGFVYGTTVEPTIRILRVTIAGGAGFEIVVPDAVRFRI